MRRAVQGTIFSVGLLGALLLASGTSPGGAAESPEWSMNASIIEACSCPMFCQCYFNDHPANHAGMGHEGHQHFCKFNNAYKINKGHYGAVKLDGAKFWLSGDLGGDFTTGKGEWSVLTFDKSTTKEQREGIQTIVTKLIPFQWGSFSTAEGDIRWTPGKEEAHATLDGGKTAEVALKRPEAAANGPGEIVMKNLKYWSAPRNDGFVMMPNTVEAYRVGDKAFEFKGTNGFMITFDIDSKSLAKAGEEKKM
jgi:hypothetical protein